jgi:hypothetical protein
MADVALQNNNPAAMRLRGLRWSAIPPKGIPATP